MRKAFNAAALAIAGLLAYVVATPYLPQDRVGQFYERAIACLADVLVPSADAATIGPVDAFTPAFGGRCTLTTATPVMTANALSQTTIYYTPYPGSQGANRIAIYNGSKLVNFAFGELSNLTSASATSSAGPAVVAASSVYDLYVWNNAGTLRLTRSPAWATAVTRGTGAATAQQDCTTVPGVCTNAVAITNGPAANRGTFVCTVASDPGSTVDWQFGSNAASGGAGIFGVWNMYNRRVVATAVQDSANTWTHAAAAWAATNASLTWRISYVTGAAEDNVFCMYNQRLTGAGGVFAGIGIGVDSITAIPGAAGGASTAYGNAGTTMAVTASYAGNPGLGSHYISGLQYCITAGTCTYGGDAGAPTVEQDAGLFCSLMQ